LHINKLGTEKKLEKKDFLHEAYSSHLASQATTRLLLCFFIHASLNPTKLSLLNNFERK